MTIGLALGLIVTVRPVGTDKSVLSRVSPSYYVLTVNVPVVPGEGLLMSQKQIVMSWLMRPVSKAEVVI